jgi:hypothetical protein
MSAGENTSINTISLVGINYVLTCGDDNSINVTCSLFLHITVGIMINKYSDSSQRSIKFENTQQNNVNGSFPYDLKSYLLKIEYLKSYENIGKVVVKVCGHHTIGEIDALDTGHSGGFQIDSTVKKVSVPDIRLYNDLHIKCPSSYLTENKFSMELVYLNYSMYDPSFLRLRSIFFKFKIQSIVACFTADYHLIE